MLKVPDIHKTASWLFTSIASVSLSALLQGGLAIASIVFGALAAFWSFRTAKIARRTALITEEKETMERALAKLQLDRAQQDAIPKKP